MRVKFRKPKRLNESKMAFYGCYPEIGDVLYVTKDIEEQDMRGVITWIKAGSVLYVTDIWTMDQSSDIDDTLIVEFDPKRSIIVKGSEVLKDKTFQMGQFYQDPIRGIPDDLTWGKVEILIHKNEVGNK